MIKMNSKLENIIIKNTNRMPILITVFNKYEIGEVVVSVLSFSIRKYHYQKYK